MGSGSGRQDSGTYRIMHTLHVPNRTDPCISKSAVRTNGNVDVIKPYSAGNVERPEMNLNRSSIWRYARAHRKICPIWISVRQHRAIAISKECATGIEPCKRNFCGAVNIDSFSPRADRPQLARDGRINWN